MVIKGEPIEHDHYAGVGCDMAPSCLNCPFKTCVEDDPSERQRLHRQRRDLQLTQAVADHSLPIPEVYRAVAKIFSIAHETIPRAMRRVKREFPGHWPEAGCGCGCSVVLERKGIWAYIAKIVDSRVRPPPAIDIKELRA